MNVYRVGYTKIPLHEAGDKIIRGTGQDAVCHTLAENDNQAGDVARSVLGSPATEIHVQSVTEVAKNVLSAIPVELEPEETEVV